MSLIGTLTGAVKGFASGGVLGGIAGGLVGGALPATGFKTPTASGHGQGYQAAGYTYQQAMQLKAQLRRTTMPVGNPLAVQSSPALTRPLVASGTGGALSLVGSANAGGMSLTGPLGSILAGAGAAASSALGLQVGVTGQGIFLDTNGTATSAPSGTCIGKSGKPYVFSILANGGSVTNQGGYRVARDAAGNVVKIYKRRRMNQMNVRSARRAIRRIRGARRILQRIERSLPKARHHASSRRITR